MPKKPTKFGIKVWALCEAMTGYCQSFQIYTGKVDGATEHGLAHTGSFDFLDSYLYNHHHVYWDNFYSTKHLFEDLETRMTYACGTIRKDKGRFPADFHKKLVRGEMIFLRIDNLVGVHWFDKRDVYALSTIHGTGKEDVLRRGDQQPVQKPEIIIECNKYMNGVDKCDKYLASYPFCRKTVKWWKKVFVRLFELSVINAMVIYFHNYPDLGRKSNAHKKFRIALIHQLVQTLLDVRANNGNGGNNRGRPSLLPEASRLQAKHFAISKYPDERKCCVVCGYKKKANGKPSFKKTYNYCVKCERFICKSCFEKYHTKSQL